MLTTCKYNGLRFTPRIIFKNRLIRDVTSMLDRSNDSAKRRGKYEKTVMKVKAKSVAEVM